MEFAASNAIANDSIRLRLAARKLDDIRLILHSAGRLDSKRLAIKSLISPPAGQLDIGSWLSSQLFRVVAIGAKTTSFPTKASQMSPLPPRLGANAMKRGRLSFRGELKRSSVTMNSANGCKFLWPPEVTHSRQCSRYRL